MCPERFMNQVCTWMPAPDDFLPLLEEPDLFILNSMRVCLIQVRVGKFESGDVPAALQWA
jgi:hypothetical protein